MIAFNLTSYGLTKPKSSYVRTFVISFLVLLSAYLFYSFLFGERGLIHYYKLKNQNEILSNQLFDLREKYQKILNEKWGPIEKNKLRKFEKLDNKKCILWSDDTKFCVFK